MRAFVFPGQGSQAIGMGAELAEAFAVSRAVFEEVDDALGQNLSKLMREGPEETLTLTENAQPALMAVSIAAMRAIEEEGGKPLSALCGFVAGHSLGEYSALCAARSIPLAETARLLKLRGQAMQKAVPVGEGAMAAVLGLDLADAEAVAEAAAQGEICAAANDNAPGQVVISGAKAAVERAVDLAKEKGAKRAMLLPVSAPFHCDLMAPAADAMGKALAAIDILPPAVPLVANISAEPVVDPAAIRTRLVEQVCGRVRWRESVLRMKQDGVSSLVEVGAGKVLSGLTRRIDRELEASAVNGPADVEAFLKTL